jgi:DNA invertase Pin-like site-specific DNA recombinase
MTRATANKTPEKKVVARGTDSADAPAPKKAGTYLRVSTASQVNTDYNPEGISLPFQRGQCELKSVELGAYVAREFLDPGSSATSIDKREVFQEMIAWAKEEGDVDYLICYHFNRMFRNSVDAGLTRRELAKCGTRIVSTVVDLGEGPESDMVETILSAVDEYQSAASGADIAYKMAAKARNGGTLGKAPLGYVNRRDTSEGRNIGISVLDEERAPFVKVAFELYATRKWSLEALQDELTERGLRTRGGRFPVGPVSVSKLAEMLRDPYYAGYVRYKGEIFNGRHEPLISQNRSRRSWTSAVNEEPASAVTTTSSKACCGAAGATKRTSSLGCSCSGVVETAVATATSSVGVANNISATLATSKATPWKHAWSAPTRVSGSTPTLLID